jgi:hypothetical protein
VPTAKEAEKQAKEEAKRKKLLGDSYESIHAAEHRWELWTDAEKCAANQAILVSGNGDLRLTFFNTYVFENSKLVEIRFTDTTTDNFTTDMEALTKRFGKPATLENRKVQNGYGATFDERGAVWDLPEGAQAVAAESVRWDDCSGFCDGSYRTSTSVLIRTAERIKQDHPNTSEVKF